MHTTHTDSELPATVSVEQAAELVGISRRHAYQLANSGDLPAVRFGRTIRVPTHRLLELLAGTEPLKPEAA